jgi:hypothetical protein
MTAPTPPPATPPSATPPAGGPPGPEDEQKETPTFSPDSPTELVPNERGDLVERLSGGTATVLLVWLMGIGAASALLAVWFFVWVFFGERLGIGALFGGPGFYTALAGASGPCILWLAGRAQGHTLGWFLATSAKISLVMLVLVAVLFAVILLTFGTLPGPGAALAGAIAIPFVLVLSVIWGLATWAADRYIARARVQG